MIKKTGEERRRFQRAERILSIKHRLYKRKGKVYHDRSWNWHLSSTRNMSLGGLLFSSNIFYEKGDIIELEVVMSGILNVFNGFGKVLRSEPTKAGLIFNIAITFCSIKPQKLRRISKKNTLCCF